MIGITDRGLQREGAKLMKKVGNYSSEDIP